MADNQQRLRAVWIRRDVLLQPHYACKVQVVRGLVKQKNVGLGQERCREANAHAPAPAELCRRFRKLRVFEA
jgi:hypothetical protein